MAQLRRHSVLVLAGVLAAAALTAYLALHAEDTAAERPTQSTSIARTDNAEQPAASPHELEKPEPEPAPIEARPPPSEDPREAARKKKLEALEKPWILQKYRGTSDADLIRALNEVESVFDQERAKAFDARRKNGQYLEAMWKETGAVPRAEGIPQGEHLEITVVNPVEKFNANRAYTDPVPVWYLVLTRDEYPAIFDLQDEVQWLRYQVRKKDGR